MEQRVSLISLGVDDLARTKAFYEELGWRGQEVEETVFFQTGGLAVVLWSRDKLADDAEVPTADRDPGFGGIVLAQNVRSAAEVDDVLLAAGARVRGRSGRGVRRSTAATPASSPIPTATCGRSPTTPGSPWRTTAASPCPTSIPPEPVRTR